MLLYTTIPCSQAGPEAIELLQERSPEKPKADLERRDFFVNASDPFLVYSEPQKVGTWL